MAPDWPRVGVSGASARRPLWPLLELSPLLALWLAIGIGRAAGTPMTGDEPSLLAGAHNLLHGGYATAGSSDPTQFLWHGPGLPALLAPPLAAGAPLWLLRLAGPLLLFAAVLLFHRLLRETLPPRWALAGAWALGLYLPFAEVVGPLHKEPVALVLLIAALLGGQGYLRDGRSAQLALAALSLAGLAMTRLEYGWAIAMLLLAAAAWAAWARTAEALRALAICAAALAACAPWLAYTHALTGRVAYWGNAGGLSLYWMAPHPHELGAWHAAHTVFADPRLASYRPFFERLRGLTPLERDRTLQRAAVAAVEAHPARYAVDVLANTVRMGAGVPGASPPLVAGCAVFALALLAGTALALVRAWPCRARLPPAAPPVASVLAAGVLVHLPASAEPRLVMPLVPLFLWLGLHARRAVVTRTGAW